MHDVRDYRQFLEYLYDGKRKRNSQFSLRAFAKQMGVTSGQLTDILKGRKNLSLAKASAVSKNLKLSKFENQYFHLLVIKDLTSDPEIVADIDLLLMHLKSQTEDKTKDFNDIKPTPSLRHSETLALSPEDLTKAHELIQNCCSQLLLLSKKSKVQEHNYQLAIQLVELTAHSTLSKRQ